MAKKLKIWEAYVTYEKGGKSVMFHVKVEAANIADAKLHIADQILKDISTTIISIKESKKDEITS